ncbi:MAG TPA: hypothetical protein VFK85_08760 [Anaeromyxobacteraceae bacterium]|nr:hypothetical protein [Anaeromyxobacteraceae bacterium]
MSCPRCDAPVDEAAVRCHACGAPLQLRDEPRPPPLDRLLDLDRRRTRTPVPASTPPPAAAELDEGDLGDLSFDAPADDGPWTMAPEVVGPVSAAGEPEVATAIDDPDDADDAADSSVEEYCDAPSRDDAVGEPSVWTDLGAAPGVTLAAPALTLAAPALALAAPALALAADDPEVDPADADADPEEDDGAEPPVEADHDRVRRGRLLSVVSLALASAAALVAVLSSR